MAATSSTSETQINETLTLIPGLPNDLSALILTYIPIPFHDRLKLISKSWRAFFSSKTLIFSLRQNHISQSNLSHLLCIFPQDPSLTSPYLFDPIHLAWTPLPPMPINPHVYALCNFSAVSIGAHLYVLGGSLFDTRSFPIDRPSPSSAAFRFDLVASKWESLSSMATPRGSFACAVVNNYGSGGSHQIVVAGGGSRHAMFGAAGSRVGSVEIYEVDKDEWAPLAELPGFRAGCAGFCVVGNGMGKGKREFWVMGGYGESRTIAGVFPVDEYYRDAVVMELEGEGDQMQGNWREIGDMWKNGERPRLGKIVVIDNDDDDDNVVIESTLNLPGIFMLDGNVIFRYNMTLNRWFKESTVPRQAQDDLPFGFVALKGELHVISLLQGVELSEIRRSRQRRRGTVLFMQIYNPRKKSWRSLVTRTPFHGSLDFRTAVMCTMCV